jgi:hypothetical protein
LDHEGKTRLLQLEDHNRAAKALDPVTAKTYVHTVPDHCDRIIWRGQYHHLPVPRQSRKTALVHTEPAAFVTFLTKDVREMATILEEAAGIISALTPETAPANMRWPIADELEGFSLIMKSMLDRENSDENAPEAIRDRNGQAALSLCKVCNKGEVELEEPCAPKPPAIHVQYLPSDDTEGGAL